MKLAQALSARKRLAEQVQSLARQASSSAYIRAGAALPKTHPDKLIQDAIDVAGQLATCIQQIDATNVASKLPNGMSIRDAMCRRLVLKSLHKSLSEIRNDRPNDSDIELVLDGEKLRRTKDNVAREWRELDDAIQQANWTHDLIEG